MLTKKSKKNTEIIDSLTREKEQLTEAQNTLKKDITNLEYKIKDQ